MNLNRCKIGHLYDTDEYSECPYCNGTLGDREHDSPPILLKPTAYANQGATLPPTEGYDNWDNSVIPVSEIMPSTEPTLAELLKDARKQNNMSAPQSQEETMETMRYSPSGDMKINPVVGWLVSLNGEEAGKSYELKAGRNFIGRSSQMDVVLKGDQSVSRDKHAIIVYEPRKREFIVQPGESKELFYLNDDVVLSAQKIQSFDKLVIGQTELYFVPFCSEKFAWEDLAR